MLHPERIRQSGSIRLPLAAPHQRHLCIRALPFLLTPQWSSVTGLWSVRSFALAALSIRGLNAS